MLPRFVISKMATLSLLRATRACRLLAPQILTRQVSPAAVGGQSALQQKSQLLYAPSAGVRVYGPDGIVKDAGKSKKWLNEKLGSAVLIVTIPAAFVYQVPATEYLLVLTLQLHNHQMFEEVITDYVHGEKLPKICKGVLLALSAVATAGLLHFTYNDVGPVGALKLLWSL